MKKILSFFLLVSLILTMVSCSPEDDADERPKDKVKKETDIAEIEVITEPEYEETEKIEHDHSADPQTTRGKLLQVMPDLEEHFFVNQLEGYMLDAFYVAYTAYLNYEDGCSFPTGLTEDEAFAIKIYLNYDCPELVQFEGDNLYYCWENGKVSGYELSYSRSASEFERMKRQTEAQLKELIAPVKNSDPERAEKYVYEEIISTCTYSAEAYHSFSAYGVLVNKVARCEGFSRTFTWAMRELDIESFVIAGGDNNDLYNAHSWNVVNINGYYCEVDVTYDNVRGTDGSLFPISYGFFNVSDKLHRDSYELWDPFTRFGTLPRRDVEKMNFHNQRGTYAYSTKQGVDIIRAQLDDGENTVYVKFDDKSCWDEVLADFSEIMNEWSRDSGIGTSYNYYWYSDAYVIVMKINYN